MKFLAEMTATGGGTDQDLCRPYLAPLGGKVGKAFFLGYRSAVLNQDTNDHAAAFAIA